MKKTNKKQIHKEHQIPLKWPNYNFENIRVVFCYSGFPTEKVPGP